MNEPNITVISYTHDDKKKKKGGKSYNYLIY